MRAFSIFGVAAATMALAACGTDVITARGTCADYELMRYNGDMTVLSLGGVYRSPAHKAACGEAVFVDMDQTQHPLPAAIGTAAAGAAIGAGLGVGGTTVTGSSATAAGGTGGSATGASATSNATAGAAAVIN